MNAEYKAPENHTDPETSNKDSDLLSVTGGGSPFAMAVNETIDSTATDSFGQPV
jgi:hypothetical protein